MYIAEEQEIEGGGSVVLKLPSAVDEEMIACVVLENEYCSNYFYCLPEKADKLFELLTEDGITADLTQ